LDYGLTGIIQPNKTYRVKAMVKTIGGDFQLGVFGWSSGQADINNIIDTNGAWQELVFNLTTGASLDGSQGMFWNNYNRTGSQGYLDNWEMYDVTDIVSGLNNSITNQFKVYTVGEGISADFNLASAGEVEFSVYNMQGGRIVTQKGIFNAGNNNKLINVNLPSGVYLVKMTADGKISTNKLVK